MPNRYIRESMIESETINSVSFQAEVTWLRLLLTVDDWGRCEASIPLLRPKLFPLRLDQVREADLQRWLAECEKSGLIRFYQIRGKAHVQMMKWRKGRALQSKYPDPPPEILAECYADENGCLQAQTSENIGLQPKTDAPDNDHDHDPDNDKTHGGDISDSGPGFRARFDEARKLYPGTKGGLTVEWSNFEKKYRKALAEIIPKLSPAIQNEIDHKRDLAAKGQFVAAWAHFRTWVNQRRWEQELGASGPIGGGNAKPNHRAELEADAARIRQRHANRSAPDGPDRVDVLGSETAGTQGRYAGA